jgi:hypothetical protein
MRRVESGVEEVAARGDLTLSRRLAWVEREPSPGQRKARV